MYNLVLSYLCVNSCKGESVLKKNALLVLFKKQQEIVDYRVWRKLERFQEMLYISRVESKEHWTTRIHTESEVEFLVWKKTTDVIMFRTRIWDYKSLLPVSLHVLNIIRALPVRMQRPVVLEYSTFLTERGDWIKVQNAVISFCCLYFSSTIDQYKKWYANYEQSVVSRENVWNIQEI